MVKDVGQILLECGVIRTEDLARAREDRVRYRRSLVESLVAIKATDEEEVASALSAHLGIPRLKLASIAPDMKALDLLREDMARKFICFPIQVQGPFLTLAMMDPLNYEAIRDVEFITERKVKRVVATKTEIMDAISQHYNFDAALHPMLENVVEELLVKTETEEEREGKGEALDLAAESQKAPIVKMVNLIIQEAVKRRASDIHIEPTFNSLTVRNRVDGVLKEVMQVPKWLQNQVVARIKILAALDITERRLPQDGRLRVWLQDKEVDIRVSTAPTYYGEKVVMRLLDKSQSILSLEQLGVSPPSFNLIRSFIEKPQGIVLVTGPTGSGKTTTLYAIMERIRSPGINIISIEDPIEYEIRGVNQIQINEKAGLTFATTLRSILRQDPNVILVGEIRDLETAEIAFQSSLTGHLVFSTLHTNDAVSSVTRLIDLGVEPFLVGSALTGIIAQRLVRLNCPDCKEPYEPARRTLEVLEIDDPSIKFYRGKGCPNCNHTGYMGRTGIFEVLRVTPQMRELIAQNAGETAIRELALSSGMTTLKDEAIAKLKQGLTTPEEVLRVIQVEEGKPEALCPKCKGKIQSDFSVCPFCLESLTRTCPSCGQATKPEWAVCPYCQTTLAHKREGEGKPAVKTPKILIVDDDESIRKIVALALRSLPFPVEVKMAADGFEALSYVEREKPDMIILDIMMPKMDGFEVCKRLRENIDTAFIPIMMLTAKGEIESRTKAFTVGTDDYVTKPFEVEDLKARVARLLRRTYGI